MLKRENVDSRSDTYTAARVDDALRILRTDGMYAALEFMQLVGVPKGVTRRVLCSPFHYRKQDRRRVPRHGDF